MEASVRFEAYFRSMLGLFAANIDVSEQVIARVVDQEASAQVVSNAHHRVLQPALVEP